MVEHYTTCPRVHSVQVIWSDLEASPPPASFYAVPDLVIGGNGKNSGSVGDRNRNGGSRGGGIGGLRSSVESPSPPPPRGERGLLPWTDVVPLVEYEVT